MEFQPTPTDGVETETSESQFDTEELISHLFQRSSFDLNSYKLNRPLHLNWLVRLCFQGFPNRYVSQDVSQPWLLFWILQSFQTLGVALDPTTKQRAIDTILANQHPSGGFGGGPGQLPHLLPTYASVCSLAIVGRPGEGGGWDQIDRQKMYEWFLSLKQPDGSFVVCHDAEVDMRGCYCLLTVATLLDMLTPELVRGTRAFVSSCQTYEGGFSASSYPYFTSDAPNHLSSLLHSPRPSLGEAHGGYTFCAVASLLLLRSQKDEGKDILDTKKLLRWAVGMQGQEIEGGGFRGRTNKLVDGCYSWWVGGLFALIEDLLGISGAPEEKVDRDFHPDGKDGDDSHEWQDFEDGLFNKQALQKFILISSQSTTGGLRDKPGKPADAYHTLYNLSGLSSAQHHVYRSSEQAEKLGSLWVPSPPFVPAGKERAESDVERNERRRRIWVDANSWAEDEVASRYVGGKDNRVNATHPVFDLTMTASRAVVNYFYGQNVPII